MRNGLAGGGNIGDVERYRGAEISTAQALEGSRKRGVRGGDFQIGPHLHCIAVTNVALFAQCPFDDRTERRCAHGVGKFKRRWLTVDEQDFELGARAHHGFAGEHFAHHERERIQIGARIDGHAARLLVGHVAWGTEPVAGLGESGVLADVAFDDFGETEVEQQRAFAGLVLGKKDVSGLDVAVNDAERVGGCQAVENL